VKREDDEAPLADLADEIVSRARIEALLADIALAAELLEVRIKRATTHRSEAGACDLAAAARSLAAGSAVQLRYRHQGIEWWDTLLPLDRDQVRIVRCRVPAG
jgi:hypothetical protein